ncbi:hypothetical protein TREMEDRAFT_70643 [Tremella mesenterica DSM 1558]|uniref:uncharacterized protein n=1 Tax=Tremella mesenterica (strain ATCC 24925 / CBS 8224 / DSM 1558 / NBRC 9311 / NRRL Y-6157 / RJB 2259-6 / UBC 559-6) TaxID=578456 RepID=UPI0003F48EA4|nr:uncharacterized protein TREMEDRAFT_70643 [Tremella mesenterica DSM 1558]EIW72173.1 hypothetical protein TREMEDRAFT_70643 [Tremella mesenterica DSM 1558]
MAKFLDRRAMSPPMTYLGRLQLCLSDCKVTSTYNALVALLSSKQSDEDIQSELVEILGFEGDGLSLVEEILKPGVRESLKDKTNGRSGPTYNPTTRMTLSAQPRGKKEKKKHVDISDIVGSAADIERRLQEQLEKPKPMFSDGPARVVEKEKLPHVYASTTTAGVQISMGGQFSLPAGTTRELNDTYEEVVVPPNKPIPPRGSERPVRINELPPLAKGCFPSYVSLNRMQSIIQPTAMNTNENLLICAPTGAGKTDIAIMSIIRVLQSHLLETPQGRPHPSGFNLDLSVFKIIYVAPMKALASEITRKFGKRLAWLGVKVRELTGDMQMTRQEIAETQVIVTTPEKWDVVTRKPTGEGELASRVKLLIIDEVHLLNEERGAVIESIVARTLRQVESSQSVIRIVGLSATLPNYIDVGDFLRVNRYTGLFFFDASFRPVPLEQHFIGVTGKPRSLQSIKNTDQVVFDKVSQLVEHGHQVMVFVHARKETVKAAESLREMSKEEAMVSFFECIDHPKFEFYRREIATSRNKEMKDLFNAGFGIHHAGMLRSDRNMMERMFEDGAIKVLCCTSTLAWGVNLPAHAVVIKGTQVYDSSKGSFVDLSVLDVLQIFGRAGRPGYETSGVGYICTTQDKLDHYLRNIMSQLPIESKFIGGMVDSLNAEISLGTIANVQEAIQWLGYTYLFVRMKREPFVYGMPHDEGKDDPQLGNKRNELIIQAARRLSEARMIRFDEMAGALAITDLGRIAAKYYLKHSTVEVFNGLFKPEMKNADLFDMLCQATEFDQIQVRESEQEELQAIVESAHRVLEVRGGPSDRHGKVNILLQAHISRVYLEDFALVSDSAYIAQNAARIIRALIEWAFSRDWANNVHHLINLSKSIEKRSWPFALVLNQFQLKDETLYHIIQYAEDVPVEDLRSMSAREIGDMIKLNEANGRAVLDAAWALPTVETSYSLRPLAHDLLKIQVIVRPNFRWNARLSATAEPFYVWIEDSTGLEMLQWRSIKLRPSTTSLELEFIIPFTDDLPESITIVSTSDRWFGSDSQVVVPLIDLVMPTPVDEPTPVLDVPFLQISCLDDYNLEHAYRSYMTTLTSIQTQAFWSFYHTQKNVFLSAPVGSGKSFLGEVAIWHAFRHNRDAVVLLILPQKEAVKEVTARLRRLCPRAKDIQVNTILGPHDVDSFSTSERTIAIATPSALLAAEPKVLQKSLMKLSLTVFDDLHLLNPSYELIITKILSLAKPARTRLIGLSSSLIDPTSLADWLSVDTAFRFNFLPRDRGISLSVHTKTFTIPHSTTLLKTMVKPTYDILKSSPGQAIIFIPSRPMCRVIATDLVRQSGTEMDLNGFLSVPREAVEPYAQRIRDTNLYEPLLHGIGYVIPDMSGKDLEMVFELFVSGLIKALLVPREMAWKLPVRSTVVILLSAQYVEYDRISNEQRVVNYSPVELVKMQGHAIPSPFPIGGESKMFIMCQQEQSLFINRILSSGLPLESFIPSLLKGERSESEETELKNLLKPRPPPLRVQANLSKRIDLRKRDMMDLLGWTYLADRIKANPSYYDVGNGEPERVVSDWIDRWFVIRRAKGEEGDGMTSSGSGGKGKGKGNGKINGGEGKENGMTSEQTSEEIDDVEDSEMDVTVEDRDHDDSGIGT